MADKRDLVTAAELDAMTPNERLAVFEQHIVTDLNQLPESFRDHVIETARHLGQERRAAAER